MEIDPSGPLAPLRDWSGESLEVHHHRASGSWIFIALYSTARGPAGGGTRMRTYPDLSAAVGDALRLAEAMALKFAVNGLDMGGGKGVLAVPEGLDAAQREQLLRRYGAVVGRLGGRFVTGPDVGTSPADMDLVAEAGSPWVFSRAGDEKVLGGSAAPTAQGVLAGLGAVLEHRFARANAAGLRIAIQGLGGVGARLIEPLLAQGAQLLVSDMRPEAARPWGDRVQWVDPESILRSECDVLMPCALGGVLEQHSIAGLRCRAVVGAANNQLAEPTDAELLRQRGILYAPDFVANSGGAVGIVGVEVLGWSPAEAQRRVTEGIRTSLLEIFARAETLGATTEAVAQELARERLLPAGSGPGLRTGE